MTYVFSSMESPHWLIVAGTALLILGFIGLALFSRRDAGDYEMASGEEQGRSEPEAGEVVRHALELIDEEADVERVRACGERVRDGRPATELGELAGPERFLREARGGVGGSLSEALMSVG